MLLQYQIDNLNKLNQETKSNNNIVIVGTKNSGRQYVIEQWSQNIDNSLIIKLEKTEANYEYSSLITALKKIPSEKLKRLSFIPSLSLSLSLFSVGVSIENDSLLMKEQKIMVNLNKITKKHTIIFIIDNSLNINDGSVEFVERYVNKTKCKDGIYKFILSEESINDIHCTYFHSISDSSYDKMDILRDLNLNPQINLSEKVVNFIFVNIYGDIGLLVDIIKDINNNCLDYNLERYDKNEIINKIIDHYKLQYANSKQLNDLLTICAIANHCFKTIDFAFLLDENETAINLLLNFAQEHYLLEYNDSGYQIIFRLIKNIYSTLDEFQKNKILNSIVYMFTNIYPSDYYNKFIFANLAGNNASTIYFMQHIFKEIRLNHSINLDDYKGMLNKKQYNIVSIYNIAFGLINLKRYIEGIKKLDSLEDLSGTLLYEINILKSQCLIKEIDELKRKRALNCLTYQDNNEAIDEDLKFRLDTRKIAAFIHTGEYAKAINTCNTVTERLLRLLEKTKAHQYEYYLNVIYRKYSYISEYDSSVNEVNKSVDFFRTHKKMYYKAFYIALNNLFSLYIINMDLKKAQDIKREIEELKIEKNNINFPRTEILENNCILYDYFNGVTNISFGVKAFQILYDATYGLADHILIASNYAAFMMLNNDLSGAREILVKEVQNVEDDKEGIYYYRICINLAICEFLMDNDQKEDCIQILKEIKYNKDDPHYNVRNNELKEIIELMETIGKCNDANKWCQTYKSKITTIINAYTTYQQGLIFTTLFDWDDD